MIIELHTHQRPENRQRVAAKPSREIAPSPALNREKPADVLAFQPYKAITQTRVILRPRTANGATRGRRA